MDVTDDKDLQVAFEPPKVELEDNRMQLIDLVSQVQTLTERFNELVEYVNGKFAQL